MMKVSLFLPRGNDAASEVLIETRFKNREVDDDM